MKRKYIIPIFVPHAGCENECVFCNQNKITLKCDDEEDDNIEELISFYMNVYKGRQNIEIAFYGGSFTGINETRRRKLLEIAKKYIEKGFVDTIRISTRPDQISKEILNELQDYNVSIIEIGVQSFNESVLKLAKRGHNTLDVENAARMIRDMNFKLGIQTLVGLPGSNYETEIESAKKVIECNPNFVRIYPLLVLKETELEKMFYERKFNPLSINDAVEVCADLVNLYTNHNIAVIRLGLQSQENFHSGKDLVAGPYHPAFRQLVDDVLVRRELEKRLKKSKGNDSIVTISINPLDINNFVGHKKQNIKFINDFLGSRKYNIIKSSAIERGTFKID